MKKDKRADRSSKEPKKMFPFFALDEADKSYFYKQLSLRFSFYFSYFYKIRSILGRPERRVVVVVVDEDRRRGKA